MSDKEPNGRALARPVRDKVCTVDEAAVLADQSRQRGEIVVLAHGTFDLLHIGHLRHLRRARREGDVLIVSLTADQFVNKGPGRPVFSSKMRAEMVGALEHVDYVCVNNSERATPVIEAIKPSVYVKGSDYQNAEEDVTGGIVEERATVERFGGHVVYTDEITFSSSNLINRHLATFDPTLDEFLESHRSKNTLEVLLESIDRIKDCRVLLVGDTIIDDYNYVSALGKPSKEHLISTLYNDREVFAGGVIAAANDIANFCKQVDVLTSFGADDDYEDMVRTTLNPNVNLVSNIRTPGPTTRKTRFIDPSYLRKLFEVYHMDDTYLSPSQTSEVEAILTTRAREYDAVVATDFGHGLISPAIVEILQNVSPFLAVNTQTNSGNAGFNLITKYSRADYVCIDAPEARLAVADKLSPVEDIIQSVLPGKIDCPHFVITQGKSGAISYALGDSVLHTPAFTDTVVDTVGAGDAFFAVTAQLVAMGVGMDQVGFIGNAAGALKVGIVGHRQSVGRVPLIKFLTTLLK